MSMLAISPAATAAIASVLSAPEVPEGSGVRLERRAVPGGDVAIEVTVASQPGPQDEVVAIGTGNDVFIDPDAVELLDDKTLDAEFEVGRVVFEIRPQPLNGDRGA
jgi:iron-sulfur cluster assembly protein